jgi:cellulose synthase/poly-beta-1,6-N-acetylglucosamine synthase-like glycosyltransferase
MSKDIISIVVPCHNEEEMVPIFHKEITAVSDQLPDAVFEMIFVNDGSKDATLAELKRLLLWMSACTTFPFRATSAKKRRWLRGCATRPVITLP